MRVAIVGSGPSGFYAAGHLLKARPDAEVDVFERLATPWGLVRGGVAPDHPKIKSVARVFEKTAADPRLRFFGNVEVGADVAHDELCAWYDAVVYAVGTPVGRRAGLPGGELPGAHTATEFVGWYNGHPDHRDLEIDLLSAQRAVVIGHGNVAVDVARMLCLTRAELAATDIADHALEVLATAPVREIVLVGRRGPEQAAFTTPELLELGELADADVVVDEAELDVAAAVREQDLDATARRNLDILARYAQRRPQGRRKRIVLRFCASPVQLLGHDRVRAIRLARNQLVRDAGGAVRARPTAETEDVPAGLVLEAIGYAGTPVAGVPFEAGRGLIPNDGAGRVVGDDGRPVAGAYVAGWVKRGPSGVIGTNKKCAQQTVDALLGDVETGALAVRGACPSGEEVEGRLRDRVGALVTYRDWQAIDAHERALGVAAGGRPRVKLTRREDLLAFAGRG